MADKLSDKTEWLLNGHTANEVDHMWVVALGYLFHGVYLVEEVSPLATSS